MDVDYKFKEPGADNSMIITLTPQELREVSEFQSYVVGSKGLAGFASEVWIFGDHVGDESVAIVNDDEVRVLFSAGNVVLPAVFLNSKIRSVHEFNVDSAVTEHYFGTAGSITVRLADRV